VHAPQPPSPQTNFVPLRPQATNRYKQEAECQWHVMHHIHTYAVQLRRECSARYAKHSRTRSVCCARLVLTLSQEVQQRRFGLNIPRVQFILLSIHEANEKVLSR
jgi:hypothetical protein